MLLFTSFVFFFFSIPPVSLPLPYINKISDLTGFDGVRILVEYACTPALSPCCELAEDSAGVGKRVGKDAILAERSEDALPSFAERSDTFFISLSSFFLASSLNVLRSHSRDSTFFVRERMIRGQASLSIFGVGFIKREQAHKVVWYHAIFFSWW